jgi:outer membrane protein TolC
MARADTDVARARLDEARAALFPRGKLTAFATASPEIECVDPACTDTEQQNFTWDFAGAFGGFSLEIVQPVYGFGKIKPGRAAARAGIKAQTALEDAAAGDVAVDVARAYWGVKLARELGWMLDDGIEQIESAIKDLDDRMAKGSPDATIQDRQRVAVLLAEAKVQRAEARQGEITALTALRILTDVADADVDEVELAPVDSVLPDADTAVARAATGRPEVRAADAGAVAYDNLADLEAGSYLPDLALVGSLDVTRAQGADDPPSVFANDPFNKTSFGLALVLRWQLDPFTTRAKTSKARAQARRAHKLADLAKDGAELDARTAQGEAATARERVDAATDGEKAARAWVAAVLQNQAVGTVEAKDLADAYIGLFQMSARKLTAVFQWNVAVVRLQRATGEFHAASARRKETP